MYLTNGRGNLSHKKMQYSYSREMFSGRAKPIRIIGERDKQGLDRQSSTVLSLIVKNACLTVRCFVSGRWRS